MRVWRSGDQRLQFCIRDAGPKIEIGQVDFVAVCMVKIGDCHATAAKYKVISTPVTGEDIPPLSWVPHPLSTLLLLSPISVSLNCEPCTLEIKTKVSPAASPAFKAELSRFTVTLAVAC